MSYAVHPSNLAPFAYRLVFPVVVLLLPIAIAGRYRYKALRQAEGKRAAVWYRYRRYGNFVLLTTLAAWWALWDWDGGWTDSLRILPSAFLSLHLADHRSLLFGIPPIAALFFRALLNASTDQTVSELHWSRAAIVRRAWWAIVESAASLLMIAAGFEAIFNGHYWGILWMVGAAIVHRVGMVFSRVSERMRFHTLKSGELRNRALAMARRMGVEVSTVCMVPAGKGHLVNAFAGSRMIALTDALPKYLTRKEIDSAIAHELSHAKHKHTRKQSLLLGGSYAALALALFNLPGPVKPFRPLLALAVVYLPMLGYYFFSRQAEFEADRDEVTETGDAETAIRALAILHEVSSVPAEESKFLELFQTHPSLKRRAAAMAQIGDLTQDRVNDILRGAGVAAAEQTEP